MADASKTDVDPAVSGKDSLDSVYGPRPDAYAVIVGINTYADSLIPNLRYARADAEGIAGVLTDPAIGRFSAQNVALLVDEAATERAIRGAIEDVARVADPEDTVVIYFAGHGAPVLSAHSGSRHGTEKFLLPHDAQADRLRATAISMQDIQRFFGWLDSRRVVCFLDCCYGGAAAAGYSGDADVRAFVQPGQQARAMLNEEFLDDLAGDGRVVVTACGANEVSLEFSTLEHGLFSHCLIAGLKGAADEVQKTGRVSVDQLYHYVRGEVTRYARAAGGSMQPRREGSVDGELYLTEYEPPQRRQAREIVATAAAAQSRGALRDAEQLWKEAAMLDPDNADANRALRDIADRRREDEATLSRQERALIAYRTSGALSGREFGAAMTVLEKDPSALDEQDLKMRALVQDLIARDLSPAQYLRALAILRDVEPAESGAISPPSENKKSVSPARGEQPINQQRSNRIQEKADSVRPTMEPIGGNASQGQPEVPGSIPTGSGTNAGPVTRTDAVEQVRLTENDAKAAGWYRAGAEQGNATSQNTLGSMYRDGRGVKQDDVEAVRWYRKAAEQGLALGQHNLGVMYMNGRGVKQDDAEAVRWFRKAAEQGDARGRYSLGFMYENGRGVKQDDAEAVRWYRKTADQGEARAQRAVGFMYANGRGVKQDDTEAVRWYRKAAEQGYALGQQSLGLMYESGRGVKQDDAEAVAWYRKSAEQDDANGQSCLGFMYANGRGVKQDDTEAVRWYRKAAEQGHAFGQYNLALMYMNGRGVPKDRNESGRWLRAAADQGYESAKTLLLQADK